MKVKICPMDELPSCTKLTDDLSEDDDEDEDECCNERECDEDLNTSTSREEALLDCIAHNSTDDMWNDTGNRINEAYGCNKEVVSDERYNEKECEATKIGTLREETLSAGDQQNDTCNMINEAYECNKDCTEQFDFVTSVVRTPSSNVTTSVDTEVTKDVGLRELDRPTRENLTTVMVADDHQSPINIRPCQAEVIDLTTPAPLCRSTFCGKKSRVTTVYPQIIDLTMSPNFIQL